MNATAIRIGNADCQLHRSGELMIAPIYRPETMGKHGVERGEERIGTPVNFTLEEARKLKTWLNEQSL